MSFSRVASNLRFDYVPYEEAYTAVCVALQYSHDPCSIVCNFFTAYDVPSKISFEEASTTLFLAAVKCDNVIFFNYIMDELMENIQTKTRKRMLLTFMNMTSMPSIMREWVKRSDPIFNSREVCTTLVRIKKAELLIPALRNMKASAKCWCAVRMWNSWKFLPDLSRDDDVVPETDKSLWNQHFYLNRRSLKEYVASFWMSYFGTVENISAMCLFRERVLECGKDVFPMSSLPPYVNRAIENDRQTWILCLQIPQLQYYAAHMLASCLSLVNIASVCAMSEKNLRLLLEHRTFDLMTPMPDKPYMELLGERLLHTTSCDGVRMLVTEEHEFLPYLSGAIERCSDIEKKQSIRRLATLAANTKRFAWLQLIILSDFQNSRKKKRIS